jgi:hypothetical protein
MNDVKTPTERFLSLTGIITKLHGHDHVITPEVEKLKRDLFNHALYAFSATSGHSIVCFAHVTNSMAQTEGDFEKASPMAQRRRWPSSPRRLAPGAELERLKLHRPDSGGTTFVGPNFRRGIP